MNRLHLKNLQERAQQLFEMSSEEEDINAYTATNKNTRSPAKIDLDDYLFQDDDNQPQQVEQSPHFENTDIELLKKCIALTNQNNQLRDLIEKQSDQIKNMKALLESKAQVQHKLRLQIESQLALGSNNKSSLEDNLQREIANLKREVEEIKAEKLLLKKQQTELKKQREQMRLQKQQNESVLNKLGKGKEIEVFHDYTVKTHKNQPERVARPHFSEESYRQRIRRLESSLSEEKGKIGKLCNFINSEIPRLKDKIVELTAKLDARVSKYLLRDFQY